MEFAYLSASRLLEMLRRREIGSEELLDYFLDRIDRFNPELNAVVWLDREGARAQARAADRARANGEDGPLLGLPMTIKDTYEVRDMPATAGAPELRDHRPEQDAEVVRRLRDAGAVVMGKTNVPLYASDLQSYNEIYGSTNNPWDLTRTPGGSSGGSAAALAAGLTPLEYGSDIGGSIRIPASFCGVCGHKPSYGLVSGRGHIPGPPGSLARRDLGVLGPLARSVDDLELALDLTAGADPEEGRAWQLKLPESRGQQLGDFRVAAWLDDPACPVDSEVVTVLQSLVERLRDEGLQVHDRARPRDLDLAESHQLYYSLLAGALSADLPDKVLARRRQLVEASDAADDSYTLRFARGVSQGHAQWLRDDEARMQLRARWAEFFEDFDLLLCPVSFTQPFAHQHAGSMDKRRLVINGEERPYMDILVWVGLSGVAYLPATVIPAGLSASGLPVGLQIIGPYLEDRTCLEFARKLQDLLGGFSAPPGY